MLKNPVSDFLTPPSLSQGISTSFQTFMTNCYWRACRYYCELANDPDSVMLMVA